MNCKAKCARSARSYHREICRLTAVPVHINDLKHMCHEFTRTCAQPSGRYLTLTIWSRFQHAGTTVTNLIQFDCSWDVHFK